MLLVLAIPLLLYAVWSARGVARPDMVMSDAPPDRGATKDQLAQSKARAAAWAGDVRKAAWVAQQYRAKDGNDAVGDKAAAETIKAADDRAAYFNDLDQFLSGTKEPNYKSSLAKQFVGWGNGMQETDKAKQAVLAWLATPVQLASAADADARMRELEGLLADYDKTAFARRELSAVWRVRGRLKVVEQLAARADREYPEALAVSLPLKSGGNKLTAARDTFAALKRHADALAGDEERAAEDKADLSAFRNDIDRLKGLAAGAVGRGKLLDLFADEKVYADPTAAAGWLKEVAGLYADAATGDKPKIAKKVQEFCEAFVPATARLDDDVLIAGKKVLRSAVSVRYRKDGAAVKEPLSADPAGLNEFTAPKLHDPKTTFVLSPNENFLEELGPTELSKVAQLYNEARGAAGERWTAKTVEELKNKCDAQKNLVDQLKALEKMGEKPPRDAARLFTRLESLLAGLRANPALTETAP
jgi:hypothetical protein